MFCIYVPAYEKRMCQQFVWCVLYTPKYQADASLPNKCEEVEGEGFGGGGTLVGEPKFQHFHLTEGEARRGSDVSVHLYKCILCICTDM